MTLHRVVESLDAVPEALRGLYEQTEDGKFKAGDFPGVYFEDDVQGLKKNQTAILEEKRKLAERYQGVDPDRYRELLEAAEAAEADKHKKDGNVEEAVKKVTAKKDERIAELERALAEQSGRIEAAFVKDSLTRAILAEKGLPDGLLPVMRSRVKVEKDEDGDLRLVILNEDGTQMVGDKGLATPDDLVKEFKLHQVFGRLFEGEMGAGGGAHTSGPKSRVAVNPFKKGAHWNLTEQMKLIKTNPALARKLEEQAKAEG